MEVLSKEFQEFLDNYASGEVIEVSICNRKQRYKLNVINKNGVTETVTWTEYFNI